MKKVIFLSTLALGALTTFAQSQNTTTRSTSQANSAPVQNISATMHDLKKNEAAQKQPAKKTDAKKADANKASNAATATKTTTNATK